MWKIRRRDGKAFCQSEEELKKAVIEAKKKGLSDVEIGKLFGITFKQLERIITQTYGLNISTLGFTKRINSWKPKNFKEETTTVWSFKQRGSWATHDGRYRGNWSPFIPRNIILKYTQPGETVLDYFVGSGTTAIEAKLLGRKAIAIDINPKCVELTLKNLNFNPPQSLFNFPIYEAKVSLGDARSLREIPDESIDLICAHPPYAGIIKYSSGIEGDLSQLSLLDYLKEMEKVAHESYRVLKPGKKCAILIGDTRKNKYIVPIGFQVINVFLKAGFRLKELVIKRQHNCKTTGFWYKKSLKHNFLLLAHEYLPIFEKPEKKLENGNKEDLKKTEPYLSQESTYLEVDHLSFSKNTNTLNKLETTTVWILPSNNFEEVLKLNLLYRYNKVSLIKSPFLEKISSFQEVLSWLEKKKNLVEEILANLKKGDFIVIQTQDLRINGYIQPLAKLVLDSLKLDKLRLKEIVITTFENSNLNFNDDKEPLKIVHKYLLVYEVIK